MRGFCLFFHEWIYEGAVAVVAPKAGPFDPRCDEQRKETKYKFICATCGKTKLEEPPCYYI